MKFFEMPDMEVVKFGMIDVITTSGDQDEPPMVGPTQPCF